MEWRKRILTHIGERKNLIFIVTKMCKIKTFLSLGKMRQNNQFGVLDKFVELPFESLNIIYIPCLTTLWKVSKKILFSSSIESRKTFAYSTPKIEKNTIFHRYSWFLQITHVNKFFLSYFKFTPKLVKFCLKKSLTSIDKFWYFSADIGRTHQFLCLKFFQVYYLCALGFRLFFFYRPRRDVYCKYWSAN